jgi:uncharacterized membrane protein YcaP (DUF421 family)
MAALRLMGKRQVGEMQPSELVVTILLSELAAIPIQDNSLPMATSLISAAMLIALEIFNSVLAVKSNRWRVFTQGHSLLVVKDGVPDLKMLKNLRISLDDLMEALRQKDVFNLEDIAYCIVETTGKISVLLKSDALPVTVKDMQIQKQDSGMPFVLVYDGQVIPGHFALANMTRRRLDTLIKAQKIPLEDIMLLTVDKAGQVRVLPKEA